MFYDIHPIKSTNTLTNAFSTTNGSAEVTINFSGDHGIQAGDIVLLDNFSSITNSNFAAANFDDIRFMATTVPSSNTITITMPSNESGSGASESGGIRVQHYYRVGPDVQSQGFGWSLGTWGGTEAVGAYTTVLSSDISASATSITVNDASQFPSSGTNFIQDRNRRNILHRYIYKHINRCNKRCTKYNGSITHCRRYSYKYI